MHVQVRGLPTRITSALADVYYAMHGKEPPDADTSAELLASLVADGEAAGELARFPGVLNTAMVDEYTLRFGVPPATGEHACVHG